MKLLYVNAYGYNFGDALGVEIAQRIVGHRIRTCDLYQKHRSRKNGVLALGSIFHRAIDNDVIWGTGVNPTWQKSNEHQSLDIRAVRGPLTRQYVQDHMGLSCPEVYGDPALLVKMLFPEQRRRPIRNYGVIPHYHDIGRFNSTEVMLPTCHWSVVLEFILGCELVISSSLHGLIVAEAFGIPARWWHSPDLPSSKTESTFKFNDYYASTNRSLDDWSETIEEALNAGGKEAIVDFDCDRLLAAFPQESLEVAGLGSRLYDKFVKVLRHQPR